MKVFKKVWAYFVQKFFGKIKNYEPMSLGWKGASIVLGSVSFLMILIQGKFLLDQRSVFDFLIGILVFIFFVIIISGVLTLLFQLLKKMPGRYIWVLVTSFVFLLFSVIIPLEVAIPLILGIMAFLSLWGALLFKWIKGSYRHAKISKRVGASLLLSIMTIGMVVGGYWLLQSGEVNSPDFTLSQLKASKHYDNTMLNNPANLGSYRVNKLTYGSPHTYRKEFNQKNSLQTKTVDGTNYLEKWSSVRTKTLGFGPDKLPLNGQVWYPDGQGVFPLVLIVHGNHLMTDYSDPGYEYLGKLLASRGYIAVSVDENFLNVSPYDDLFLISPLKNENSARGLLLLEHLQMWKEWNKNNDNPFYQKVDMEQIALIGHSRGGEAIAIAAAFNEMNHPPNNGNIKFDYHFSIRSLVSIAGTDGQYLPSGKSLPLKNINYLALQGAHDMDVNSFASSNQYNRISYSDKEDYMNASVYIYGANHGQFNEKWGRGDGAGTANQFFNLQQIMPREQQETVAKILISAFLDSTLKEKKNYQKIFQDLGYAKKWLPDTQYISNYYDSQTSYIATFNEDIDLNTTTVPGGKLNGENLKEWKEEKVKLKFTEAQYSAVQLGWESNDLTSPSSYTITLPDRGLVLEQNNSLVFSLAAIGKEGKEKGEEALIDFTITVEDSEGGKASLPLSHVAKLPPAIKGDLLKKPFSDVGPITEPVFQYYKFLLNDFQEINSQFNPSRLEKIHFQFNLTKQGKILLNNIGLRLET
ncbi:MULTISPECIES: chlorophyllase/cutinase-like alpha/beta fold protein [Lysinibacillus]|uniref:poly(ethylene terephthalate) hydrolase family protein n=1 Tax=Lysinibacillus TaxID=400634 RepID=UPI00257D3B95|nr:MULTISPECIES: MFS transporter [Lysinibacillus]